MPKRNRRQKRDGAGGGTAPRQGVQVIARAAEILRALEGHDEGLSLGQLANMLALPRSTVQRIVNALDAENFVIAASPTARVRLGPALIRIASSTPFRIAALARPYLESLSQATGETVDLAILDESKLVFIDQIRGIHRLQAVSAIGVSFPLHCTANGKAVLAALDAEQYARVKSRVELAPHTEQTITSWPSLEAEIERVRETGMAYDREEHSVGICAVACAVRGPMGELAAISLPTPTPRFLEKEEDLAAALLDCCRQVKGVLGDTRSD